ncbi:MAG: hypothetical protein V3V05_02605 [Pontiella sp.]
MTCGIKRLCVCWLVLVSAAIGTHAVDNPIDVPLDGSVVRYNGVYYGMGAETNGQMLVSDDLLHWGTPVSVLPETVEGPYELINRNGLFYLYAQGRGFGVSDDLLKPFSKIRKSGLSGEEMRLYQDGSGALFSVNRRVGSKKEGEIWFQRYGAPWKTLDKPKLLMDGRRGMWDSLDSADLGEPEIVYYRNNYYLLYAANNPSPRTGFREIGIAVNENPLRFSNTDKLAEPTLVRNADRLANTYAVLLPSGEYAKWEGRYTTKHPEKDWNLPDVKLSGWRTGDGGFGFPSEINGTQLHACRTKWKEDQIWVRREFDLPKGKPEKMVLNIRHEGAVQVFINGKNVFETTNPSISYSNFDISEAAMDVVRDEDNVIAVRSVMPKGAIYRFLDFGLYDAGDEEIEPTVYGVSNPRLMIGPNGFEHWIGYQAWWNGVPGTGLDRVFFYDDELVIDGPTTAETTGYHPPPAKPTFVDNFPDGESTEWAERWGFDGGQWVSMDGALRQSASKGAAKAYLNREPVENYLFETGIRFPESGKGDVGVIAWSDGEHDLVISFNPSARTWEYHIEPGNLSPQRFKLPKAFRFLEKPPGVKQVETPLHRLRIRKNGSYFDVSLDEIDLLPGKPIITRITDPGVPGFYCNNSNAEFGGVIFTIGWDEHDEYINGWKSAHDGTPSGGDWSQHRDLGLEQRSHSTIGRAFKGDLLEEYEFTVNVQTRQLEEGDERLYGVFPVFADQDNYLKAMIDTRSRELVVTGKRNGRDIKTVRKSLRHRIPRRHLYDKTTSYRDVTSWVYGLRSESIISALDIRWLEGDFDHLQQEFYVPADDMIVRYAKLDRGREPNLWEDGRFYDADEPKPVQQKPAVQNHVSIRPETANYVGFGLFVPSSVVVNSRTGRYIRDYTPGEELGDDEEIGDDTIESDTMSRPQETLVTVEVESSYFFRCVKLENQVIIELNGRPMVTIDEKWPPSQVGLVTEGQPSFFDGITLMHLPTE